MYIWQVAGAKRGTENDGANAKTTAQVATKLKSKVPERRQKYTSQLRAAQSRYKEQNQTTRLGTLTGGLFDLDDFAVHLAMAV